MASEHTSKPVAIVTGASSGIGRATTLSLSRQGYQVVAAARRPERLADLKKQCPICTIVPTDITDEQSVAHLFQHTADTFGRLDLLVNNAGRGLQAAIPDISYEDWLSVMHTNCTGVFLCTKAALAYMTRGGVIVTVSSMAGRFGVPNYAAYCASKHAVEGFQKAAWWELRKRGIACHTLHPARVNTAFFEDYDKQPGQRQLLDPQDIADVIVAYSQRRCVKAWGYLVRNFVKRLKRLIFFKRGTT